ncbi:MAG: ABC transporter substrate-binding protein [Pyrinomonadaceae bacterium]
MNYKPKHFGNIFFAAILLFAAISNIGCKQTANPGSGTQATQTLTDDIGREVTLPKEVTRAVSLAPNLTEIAFSIGAGEKIVGDTTYCDYPEGAKKVKKVGDTIKPNLEAIIALKPQVVFVSTASQLESFTKTLEAQGIKVFVSNPNSLEGIYRSIVQIGEILGAQKQAHATVADMKGTVDEIEKETTKARKIPTFVQIDASLYTIGNTSFIADVITKAGGELVTKDVNQAYFKISKEKAAASAPEAIILTDSPDNQSPNEVFNNSTAIKNRNVFKINADILSRPGPRTTDALEEIASFYADVRTK